MDDRDILRFEALPALRSVDESQVSGSRYCFVFLRVSRKSIRMTASGGTRKGVWGRVRYMVGVDMAARPESSVGTEDMVLA